MSMVYYKDPQTGVVFGYDNSEESQLPYIQAAIDAGWEDVTANWPPTPTPEEKKQLCVQTAKYLISQADWSVLPDVNLANKNDFVAYRAELRSLIINPVADPVWPTEPQPVWS